MIEIRKGNLFEGAPESAVLAHACNAMGKWGSGIAAEFRRRYPIEYQVYQAICAKVGPIAGYGFLANSKIGCLVTSVKYGPQKDPVDKIAENTVYAVRDLVGACQRLGITEIHSPKINAGLFAVPWEQSLEAIRNGLRATDNPPKWIVWELETESKD